MSVFDTSPVAINDGTVAKNFSFRAQIHAVKGVASEWVEEGADVVSASKITIKHDPSSKTTTRHLLQSSELMEIGTTGVYEPVTVNISVVHNKLHTEDQIARRIYLARNASAPGTFISKFLQGQI